MALEKVDPDFLWGVAIASHQNDGGAADSDWTHAERRGRFPHASEAGTGFRSRWGEDLDRVAYDLGGNAFRLSIEWARLEPRQGEWDPAEIAHLHALLDGARSRGLKTIVTLHHFTSPVWIYEGKGATGWESMRTAEAFVRYAAFVATEFGEAIDYYLTFNEASNLLAGGYLAGKIPPFRWGPLAVFNAARCMMKAHELAYDAIHAIRPQALVATSEFSGVLGLPFRPVEYTPGRILAALQTHVPHPDGQQRVKHLDFVSLHYYGEVPPLEAGVYPLRPFNFGVRPERFENILRDTWKAYRLPILIGENGFATNNHLERKDGWTAPRYLEAHVRAMQRVMSEGVPIIGYLWWTLTDNYEWGSYDARFGLYRVDCRAGDLERRPMPTVEAYRSIIAAGGVADA